MKSFKRFLFFLLSLLLTLIFSINPGLLVDNLKGYNMYLVIICIIGICFGFVYGIGYKPNSKFLRFIMSPLITLMLILIPLFILNINKYYM